MTDKAMKCAEEIVTDSWISQRHILDQFDDAYCKGGVPNAVAAATEKTAAIIRKHYSSSWVEIVEGKPETLPPANQPMTVFVHCDDKRYVMRNVAWNGYDEWETCNEDGRWYLAEYRMTVTHWMDEPLPAAPEEEQ